MNKMIKSVKGFNDFLPRDSAHWLHVEEGLTSVLKGFGYENIRLPIVEKTELFSRSIGDVTDIVEKEMFCFFDKSDPPNNLALRPEGTAGVVRAVIEHNMLRGDAPKLWYMGPMFRYEQPQEGRYRQFHQLGVEMFGNELPDAEAELIDLTLQMWKKFGIEKHVKLEINSLGELDERMAYRTALVEFLLDKEDALDADSQRRLYTNPLRILDSKDPTTQHILENAPQLSEFLGEDSQAHFAQVQSYLDALGIAYVINPKLVRGLDYYNKTVFEWVTDKLGSQATVCAGGRYDGLIGQLKAVGAKPNKVVKSDPAVGFAIGLERLILLIKKVERLETPNICDVFVVAHPEVYVEALIYAQQLRNAHPHLKVKIASGSGMKSQIKKADKSGAKTTVIIAQQELADNTVSVKNMATGVQTTVARDEFIINVV